MACPTCGHSMSMLTVTGNGTYYHCPRCGTVLWSYYAGANPKQEVYTPKLVDRCRELQATLMEAGQPQGVEALRLLGILEAINTPENRPTQT